MKLSNFSPYDVKLYFKRTSGYYLLFVVAMFVGFILAVATILSSESYLNLLTSENKTLYKIINGVLTFNEQFYKRLFLNLIPLVIIFLLGLNFIASFLSFIYVAYQSCLLMMSISAIISVYGISGFLNALFLAMPINLAYFAVLAFFLVTCHERSCQAHKYKSFKYNLDSVEFWLKICVSVLCIVVLTIVVSWIIPLIIKSIIFVVF